jgi:thiol-disulfide isomerase/thioredoxin
MKFLNTCIALLFFIGITQSLAQGPNNTLLKVGDPAPEFRVFEWIKGAPIQEFKKGSWYVIELGATWCKPCRAAIPKLNMLAEEHDDLTVVGLFVMEPNANPKGTTPSYVDKVKNYVAKQGDGMKYTIGVDDGNRFLEENWIHAAGKTGIPQAFIIDPKGRIAWMGSNTDELIQNTVRLLANKEVTTQTSSPTPSHTSELERDPNVFFSSSLSGYVEGQKKPVFMTFIDNFLWAKKGSQYVERQGTVMEVGQSLRRLYYMAYADTLDNFPIEPHTYTREYPDTIKRPHMKSSYGKYWYRPILEMTDSTIFEIKSKSTANKFNYRLQVPKKIGTSGFMQQAMRRDLETYFGYRVSIEKRFMPCWNLVVTDEVRKSLVSKGTGKNRVETASNGDRLYRNGIIRDLIFELEIRYGYAQHGQLVHHPELQPPFFDQTGIKGEIDYTISAGDIRAIIQASNEGKKFPFEEYRKILKRIGIDLVKSAREFNVVVIRN